MKERFKDLLLYIITPIMSVLGIIYYFFVKEGKDKYKRELARLKSEKELEEKLNEIKAVDERSSNVIRAWDKFADRIRNQNKSE